MGYSRWIALGLFVVLLLVITFHDKGSFKAKFNYYSMTFVEGMIGGLIIDAALINAGYYYFPRQPFLSWQYFAIVVPCWGVFGLLVNCLWKWIGKDHLWRGLAVTIVPLFILYEGTNLLTGSWVYTAPIHSVILGWLPLGLVFAGCNRRRRVKHKIEMWMQMYPDTSPCPALVRGTLCAIKYGLMIIMFPLILISIFRLLINLRQMIKANATTGEYVEYAKLMVGV